MNKIWMPVLGFNGRYSVNRFGDVYSHYKNQTCRPFKTLGGYKVIKLHKKGKTVCRPVARIVAEAFIGPRPKRSVLRFLDWNRNNCSVENLRYVPSFSDRYR